MHRSSSSTRFSDEFHKHLSSPSTSSSTSTSTPAPSTTAHRTSISASDVDKLPTYNPDSHLAKKERSRIRSAENAIHLIPLVLVLCAIMLWCFSKPVDIINKGDSNVLGIQGLTMDGNTDSDGTQSGLLPNLDLEDFHQHLKPIRFTNRKRST